MSGKSAYVPPHKLRRQLEEAKQRASSDDARVQALAFAAACKRINGIINRVNAENVAEVLAAMLAEVNVVRMRGHICRSLMTSQAHSPTFTPVYACLVAVVNTKFPEVGELIVKRLVLAFRRAYASHDKARCVSSLKFLAHLVNQSVVHELLALEAITLLLHTPSPDAVELAVSFIKEVGAFLHASSPRALMSIMDRARAIMQEEESLPRRSQYAIEGLFAVRRDNFKAHPAVPEQLDLVESEDQIVHDVSLEEEGLDAEEALDKFQFDENYDETERQYKALIKEILDIDDDDEGGGGGGGGGGEERQPNVGFGEDEDGPTVVDASDLPASAHDANNAAAAVAPASTTVPPIQDQTGTDLVALRRTIYLAIMSSIDFEEAGHKLMKLRIESPEDQRELCVMIIECCSQERSYLRYFGLLAQRFCELRKSYQMLFADCFAKQYSLIHRLETNKLRNVAKLFAHLFASDALPWPCLKAIRMTEDDTTSSSRIFCKILFQELSELLGLKLLSQKLNAPDMEDAMSGIFPKDSMRNARFSINFFTSIGLGGVTDAMREWLKHAPAQFAAAAAEKAAKEAEERAAEEERERERRAAGGDAAGPQSSGSYSYSYSGSYSYSYSGSGSYSYSYSGSDDEDDARSDERGVDRSTRKRDAPAEDAGGDGGGTSSKKARR
ncbi:pre-mRNA-splicing factor CWC22 [Pseudoscourfieldia marina]